MQLDWYDRFCMKLILTAGAIGSLWLICYLLSIPPSEVVPMTIALVSISAGLRRPVSHLETLPITVLSLGTLVGLPAPGSRIQRILRIPRALSITLIYLIFIGLLIWASARVIPLVEQQISAITLEVKAHWVSPNELMEMVPDWAKAYVPPWLPQAITDFGKAKVGDIAGYLTSFVGTMSGMLATVLEMGAKTALLLVLVFPLTQTEGLISSYVTRLIKDEKKGREVKEAIDNTMLELGQWANAQVLIGGCYGVAMGMVMPILGLPFGFTIGLVGFLLESVLPMIGALFALFVALPVAVLHGGLGALVGVLVAWAIIFALEWHLIYPLIMGRTLKFDAFITLFFMWLGFFPLGILGSVLVMPCMVIGCNMLKYCFPHIVEKSPPQAPAHHQVIGAALQWAKTRLICDNDKTDNTQPPPTAT